MRFLINFLKKIILKGWNSPTFTSWGNLLSSSIKLLVVTPLILVKFDVDLIAFWYLLLSIQSLGIVFDFGLLPTLSRFISFAHGGIKRITDLGKVKLEEHEKTPNWELIIKIYSSTRVIYLFVVLLILTLFFVIGYFVILDFVNRSVNSYDHYWTSYTIFCSGILIGIFAKSFESVLIGTNKIALNNRWNILINTLSSSLMFLILLVNPDLFLLAIATLVASTINLIRTFIMVRLTFIKHSLKVDRLLAVDKNILILAWPPVWRSALGILGSTGVVQIIGLIYSTVADSAELATYLFSLKMITTISQFSQAPFYSRIPEFAALRAQGDISNLISRTQKAVKNSLLVFSIMVFVLIEFGDFGMDLINSNTNLLDYPILILMAVVYYLERHHAMHAQIYSTTNRIPFYIPIIISGAINLGLILLLLPQFGIWSFPMSHGISNLLINNWWNVKVSVKSLKISASNYMKASFLKPTLLFLCLIIVVLLSR